MIYRLGAAGVIAAFLGYGFLLVRQHRAYINEVRNPELASFQEFADVLRTIIPEELCPVAVKSPVMWLAFPEKDRCFANIERRMAAAVDIDGKDYALIVRPKNPDYWAKDLNRRHRLLGELTDTPYGNFLIYYTGVDPRYGNDPKRYHFFRRWSGHMSDQQVAQAREVWAARSADLRRYSTAKNDAASVEEFEVASSRGSFTELSTVELQPASAYELIMDLKRSEGWELVLSDDASGSWLKQIELDGANTISELFRTFGSSKRVRLLVRSTAGNAPDKLLISRISIRQVGGL